MIQLGAPPPKGTPPQTATAGDAREAGKTPPPVIPKRKRGGPRGPVFVVSNMVVLFWLLVTAALLVVHNFIDHPVWLAVHALLLGAATNAIIIWSEHFTTTLCRVPDRPPRDLAIKLGILNVGVVAALAGVWTNVVWITGLAGALVAVIAGVHGAQLISMKRAALSARFGYLVDFYLAAIVALLIGALAGATMAFGVHHLYARLWTLHVHVMLFGWIGFTVIGTLFTLWPTTIREKITDRSYGLAHRTLPSLTVGLGVVLVGMLTANAWATLAGFVVYAAGVVIAAVALWPTRRPGGPAAWMMASAVMWLGIAVVVEAIVLALTRSVDTLPGVVETTVIPLLAIGFVAQILIGALTQLLPLLVAHGPGSRKAVDAYLARGWQARFALLNLAAPLVGARLPAPVKLVGWAFAAIAVAGFLWLALRLAVPVMARGSVDAKSMEERYRRGMTASVAAAALAAAVLAPLAGVGGTEGAAIAAGAQTVDVSLANMRVAPDTLEVSAGTHLVLKVTNVEAIPHDLRTDKGDRTPRLNRGETAILDVGVVDRDIDLWCDVPGHRAAGMTMTVRALGAAHDGDRGDKGTGGSSHSGQDGGQPSMPVPAVLNLAADPSPGWQPFDAALPPATPGVHRVELHAVDREIEVAPGRKETRWTWGGTEPGEILRGRVGDRFEITLVNDSTMGHGIDFHAGMLAPDQPMRTLAPGERSVYKFTARHAGAWLYHCSTLPQSLHIANGMYGAVIIDPPDLPKVDREYVLVGAQLFLGDPGSDAKPAAIRANQPDGWMFNGMAAQYDHAPLTARVGERVRVWVVNAGPGDTISFHVIGNHFDTVYREGAWQLRPGATNAPSGGSQALDLSTAQGGFVEMVFPEPGHYPFVDHDMRHAEAGAHGFFAVIE